MASSYFTLPSFARAKKNKDELEKAGVKDPVLKDDDEKFLARVASNDKDDSQGIRDINETRIRDDGTAAETGEHGKDGVIILPGKQPEKDNAVSSSSDTANQAPKAQKEPSDALNELPSQEEAEAATKGFQAATQAQADKKDGKQSWSSYIQSLPARVKSSSASIKGDDDDRTWSEFASSYLPALPTSWTKSTDIKTEPVYKADGTIDEQATKDKQEKEVSVLLDNLSLSSINNRVFSFSDESQKIYERFVQVLKDVINGVPTAYEDMEKLMKEAGPTIEKQWNAMPPFVQTLVKALPAKLGATLGPEFLAATSEKPGFDAKTMNAADEKTGKGGASSSSKKKKKRSFKIPGLKGLVKKQGLAATILRNIVVFFETRFPFLVTTTNVVMSLSVFVLMFVFYYCWKRGRDVRLAKEHETHLENSKLQPVDGGDDDDDDDIEVEITDEDDEDGDEDNSQRLEADIARSVAQKNQVLQQKDPAQVPLPVTPNA